ncbi:MULTISPECIES: TolC family protein [unclassified Coleofasciculus]|uniref:TolC family protein n=1 Tax=unclassified Coleofasciculus TaxID=2692782 RepID=UPI0018817D06|nr:MULTISPECIES: TolC family protein [unclassified Coleofasciculus]MBE9130079.1 TolC family protein [Coleofasciculus sp. LEGE 07081]MBE9152423.1 TolC family protein [Coleofasciculus sp. LEGE 07092]
MPTFRYFVAVGVGTAIALLYIKPSASEELPSLALSESRVPIHEQEELGDWRLETGNLSTHPSTEGGLPVHQGDNQESATKNRRERANQEDENTASSAIAVSPPLPLPSERPLLNHSRIQVDPRSLRRRDFDINNQQNPRSIPSTIPNAVAVETEADKAGTPRSSTLLVENDRERASTPVSEMPIGQLPTVEPSVPILDEPTTPAPEFPTRTTDPLLLPTPTTELLDPTLLNPSANPLLFPTRPEDVEIQTIQPITLEQAIELARRNNRELQQSLLALERSQFALAEALAAEYPTASLISEFTRTESAQSGSNFQDQLSELLGIDSQDNNNTSTTFNNRLEVNYAAYTAGRRSATIRAAEEQVRFQQLDVERISEDLRLNVSNVYYNLQEADAQVEISQAAVTDAARSLQDAVLREQAGLGTRFEVLQAQVELANNNQQLTNSISQQRIVRRQLVQVLSLDQQVAVSAADPIQLAGNWDLSLEESIIIAFKNRAELEQQLIQRTISQQQQRIALAAIRPQLSLFGSYNILADFGNDDGPEDGFTLGARLQWNFFDGGAARARAAQEEVNEAIAETQFANQRNQIRFQVEQAFFELKSSQENIQTATLALEQARESLRLARLRVEAGIGTQTDVINQQTALTRARINLLTAILDYNRALVTLQRSISNLADGNLFDLP